VAAIFRGLKGRWYLPLALGIVALVCSYYLQDTTNQSSYVNLIRNFIAPSHSSSRAYVQVVEISHRAEKRGGDWYATIYVTIENISNKIITELNGTLKYTAGRPQTATLQYKGKIPPRSQEKISVYVQIPRRGGLFGRFKVNFSKVEVQ
jgi:hypothetical protein